MDKYNIDDEIDKRINKGLCPRCMVRMNVVNVHGHTQCPACHCVIDDCCQGETIDKNYAQLHNNQT